MFYTFSQNNSGGGFMKLPERGIAHYVIVEGKNANDANNKAQIIGIYFNGVGSGDDCDCCGDRWEPVTDDDGTSEPTVGDKTISEYASGIFGDHIYVHYADGRLEHFDKSDTTRHQFKDEV